MEVKRTEAEPPHLHAVFPPPRQQRYDEQASEQAMRQDVMPSAIRVSPGNKREPI
jgi:hypothetical protein